MASIATEPISGEFPETSLPIWRNPDFLKLWIAQAISQTAQNVTFFALLVYVEDTTGSSAHLAALVISTVLPAVLFGVASGVFVDRWNKRAVLVATNALRAVAVLGYLFLGESFLLFYTLNFIFATISQFFLPAEGATMPLLVGRKQLITANSFFNLTFTGSQALGFVLIGPLLVKALGTSPLLIGVSVSYVLCAALCAFLPNVKIDRVEDGRGIFSGISADVSAGWQLLTSDIAIGLSMLHLTLVTLLTLMLGVLIPGYASRVLLLRPEDAGFIFAPAGLGIILGAATIPRLAARVRKLTIANVGLVLFGFGLLLVALVPTVVRFAGIALNLEVSAVALLAPVMVAGGVMGVALAMVNIAAQTILQERAPEDMRGRVFAIQLMFGSLASIIPLVTFAQLADSLGVPQVTGLVGLFILGAAYFSIRKTREVRAGLETLGGTDGA